MRSLLQISWMKYFQYYKPYLKQLKRLKPFKLISAIFLIILLHLTSFAKYSMFSYPQGAISQSSKTYINGINPANHLNRSRMLIEDAKERACSKTDFKKVFTSMATNSKET